MNNGQDIALKVFNASAGSGKTHNLVKEFIQLLVKNYADPLHFSRIIAMTFTNKAALEMKTRMIRNLDALSHPAIATSKTKELAEQIAINVGISTEEVYKRSKIVLQHILHSYEDFFVMTIDKFNLRLIRSFSRDLDLPSDFEVILNETEVIEQVVDLLLNNLGRENLETLTKIVFEYAKINLDEGERWNFRDQLIDFGTILNKEKDQQHIQRLLEMDFSIERHTEFKQMRQAYVSEFRDYCKKVIDIYSTLNIEVKNLPGASNTSKKIESLSDMGSIPDEPLFSTTLLGFIDNPPENKVFPIELRDALRELNSYVDRVKTAAKLLDLYLRNFFNMALLQYMAKLLENIKKDEQLIRISEFNKLISALVRSEDAPFIYERLGVRFHHFLLDEFQDTSRLQWLNMVPLLHESISNQRMNLIVGDPKQSIYRFKNGVAEQFIELPGIYNPEQDPMVESRSKLFKRMGEVMDLNENWRSAKEIVEFNNELFTKIKEHLPAETMHFYKSVEQKNKSTLSGFVHIESQAVQKNTVDLIPRMVEFIEECRQDGFKMGDICILSDVNVRASNWAIQLNDLGYKVVSADSLLVQNEAKVKLVISYLKLRLNPSSKSEQKYFAELYFRLAQKESFENYRKYIRKTTNDKGKDFTIFDSEAFLRDYFSGEEAFMCHYENLYDLVQSFYSMMHWDELKNPYLHHFADFVHEYELSKGPDIRAFLDHYKLQKAKLAIQLPESDDAIRIMTIHKAKGLEFPVVILPFIDFSLAIKGTAKFLLDIDEKLVYTTLSARSPLKEILDFQVIERGQVRTDKMNQFYVAFTRPEERLYVCNYHGKSDLGSIAHSCFETFDGAKQEAESKIIVQIGQRNKKRESAEIKSQFFEPKTIKDHLWFPEIALRERDADLNETVLSQEQRFGNQFHSVIAALNNLEQLDEILQQFIKEGIVEANLAPEIARKISTSFSYSPFVSLFENALEILNEQSIVVDETTIKRPDKVILKSNETIVLDYKTGSPNARDEQQMKEYLAIFQAMNYPNVRGYLYYISSNELKAI